jgi:hypothetical protein
LHFLAILIRRQTQRKLGFVILEGEKMATNPKIPSSLEPNQAGGLKPEPPTSGRAGVILALITAALLLGAILYFMPRAPKAAPTPTAAEVPQQPVPGQVQLTNTNMTLGPTGNSMNIDAMAQNTSNQTIIGLAALVRFHGQDGAILDSVNLPVEALTAQSGGRVDEALTKVPIKPNDTRPIRIAINRVPPNWNHKMPEIQISAVSSHP